MTSKEKRVSHGVDEKRIPEGGGGAMFALPRPARAQGSGLAYSVAVLGDTHFDQALQPEFVANYDIDDLTTTASSKIQPFVVKNAATFAIMPGADIGSGAVTVENGATLEVAASGTATHRGNLSLADGACLGFNFTEKTDTPTLAASVNVSLPATVNVKISSADGVRPKSGTYVLTSFGGFDAEGLSAQLAAGAPDWVKSLSVNDDGNLELTVKRKAFTLIVK